MKKYIILGLLSIFFVACGNGDDVIFCTTSIEPGIVVEVRDAISDAPIAEHAIVVITDGAYQETLIVTGFDGPDSSSANSLSGAYERPGVYDIKLSLFGYESWSRSQVEVESGICHVNTVTFTVRLSAI